MWVPYLLLSDQNVMTMKASEVFGALQRNISYHISVSFEYPFALDSVC